ncbi:hypothetical protein [Dokdonella sp.]|uniref:hypothetical protein n=1 Tax=Dokdonella sp. TaxID=2291710 RepID=UPI002F41307F
MGAARASSRPATEQRRCGVGLEREGFRKGQLAVAIGMLYVDPVDPEVTSSWGGIYVTAPTDIIFRDDFELPVVGAAGESMH